MDTYWDVGTAAGFVWSLMAPSTFDLLVVQHGWSARKWAESTFQLLSDAFIVPTPVDRPTANTHHEAPARP